MSLPDELPIPSVAAADATEIARVWVDGDQQHLTLRVDVWDDPAAWGVLFADIARHVASALQEEEGRDPGATLARIKLGFDAELQRPTDDHPPGEMLS
jgi:hypothetical protein